LKYHFNKQNNKRSQTRQEPTIKTD